MTWARSHEFVVVTHDLDFGTMLALTRATGPSVIQIRAEDVLTESLGVALLAALRAHEADIADGALLVVDPVRCRVRILPLN